MKLYLASAMRGIKHYAFEQFDAAANILGGMGHEVFSPAARDREVGFDPIALDLTGNEDLSELGFDLREAIRVDLDWICKNADAVIVLPGWGTSSGAKAEVATAHALGINVHRLHEFMQWGTDAPSVQDGLHESDDWRNGQLVEIGSASDVYLDGSRLSPPPGEPLPTLERTELANEEYRSVTDLLRAGWERHGTEGDESPRVTSELAAKIMDTGRFTNGPRGASVTDVIFDEMTPWQWDAFDRMFRTVGGELAIPLGPDHAEVRVTSETGGSKGRKLAEMGAIDATARLELARVAGFGARKYDRSNYLLGIDWSLSVDALYRHLMAWESGEDRDEESGLLHTAHVAWHALALVAFQLRGIGTDDRSVDSLLEARRANHRAA